MAISTASPHLHEGTSTAGIMQSVILCLLPAGAWGVLIFGKHALYVLAVSIGASLLTELAIAGLLLRRFSLADGSAALTGLLVGYTMPPGVPLFIPAVASVFAIAVVKMSFGGLGRNWMNPALGARVFVLFCWPGLMGTWQAPLTLSADALTGASPLGAVKTALLGAQGSAGGPLGLLALAGQPPAAAAGAGPLAGILAAAERIMPAGYGSLLLGNKPGCIGEVSIILLVLGSIYLLVKKIIRWEIPAAYLGCFAVLIWIFGGLPFGRGLFHGDAAFHLLTGGLVLGALYMATDTVTSPMTRAGMIAYGVGCGLLTFLIRLFGSLPEGASIAIIIMNMLVPLINRVARPRRYGAYMRGR